MNLVELEPGGSIPEHDETGRDQEEVFIVARGHRDGHDRRASEHPAPGGTFVRVDPEPRRTSRTSARRRSRVLIVSAPVASGYEPMDWA